MGNTRRPLAGRGMRQQAAVDFMVSYGIALLILAIAMYVILSLGIFSSSLASSSCTSAPGFACDAAEYYANGIVIAIVTQSIGGTVNVIGIGCSSAINTTGNGPEYGNTKVQSYAVKPQYYPNAAMQNGMSIYSGSTFQLIAYCYQSGGIAKPNIGSVFTGYVWMNYTYTGLPPNYYTVNRVLQFTEKVG